MATEVIVYEYEFIEHLATIFSAELDENTLNNLLEIKKNNKFIRRKSPLRLSYKTTAADTWRKNRVQSGENSNSENAIFDKLLISNLNKISDQNYPQISRKITDIYDSIITKDDSIQFINTICNKAMTEPIYSELYSKLIGDINTHATSATNSTGENSSTRGNNSTGDNSSTSDNSSTNNDILLSVPEIVLEVCNKFFGEFNKIDLQELKDVNDYNKLCEITKMKSHLTGGYIFIANLYKYEIVSHEIVKAYYALLVSHTEDSSDEYIGKYIDAIVNILANCGKKLLADNPDDFKTVYMDICYKLISTKMPLLPKYKFKIRIRRK